MPKLKPGPRYVAKFDPNKLPYTPTDLDDSTKASLRKLLVLSIIGLAFGHGAHAKTIAFDTFLKGISLNHEVVGIFLIVAIVYQTAISWAHVKENRLNKNIEGTYDTAGYLRGCRGEVTRILERVDSNVGAEVIQGVRREIAELGEYIKSIAADISEAEKHVRWRISSEANLPMIIAVASIGALLYNLWLNWPI